MPDLDFVVAQINKKHQKFEAEIRVLKVLVIHLTAVGYITAGITEAEMRTKHKELARQLRNEAHAAMHSADADDWAAAIEAATADLLGQIEASYLIKRA